LVAELKEEDTRIIPSSKAQKVAKARYFARFPGATRNNPVLGMMAQIVQTGAGLLVLSV
jgi:hypothetical protein